MKLPDREALEASFRAAVEELQQHREAKDPTATKLTTGFNRLIGEAVFTAGWDALGIAADLEDGKQTDKRLKVVSAPMGTGKSSSAVAFAAALVRTTTPSILPCLILVNEIDAAEQFYCELAALLPGRVGIWTTDHDKAGKQAPQKVTRPDRARHYVEELQDYPVVIVTTNFYAGKRGHKARQYLQAGKRIERLTIIDEQPREVNTYDVTLTHVSAVAEAVAMLEENTAALKPLNALVAFMADRACAEDGLPLEKPSDWHLAPELRWFATAAAKQFAERHKGILGTGEQAREQVAAVFGFARALTASWAFMERFGSKAARFVGYEVAFQLPSSAVLLDATGDIDGRTQICPWRSGVPLPEANYSNLEIVHVHPLTNQRLKRFLEKPSNRRAYVDWMMATIKANTAPGERGLVVCKKKLLDEESLPDWPTEDPKLYTEAFGWELEGRLLSVTNWGAGIGSNRWKEADVVFLFDEFHLPARQTAADTQGLMRAKATEGPLGSIGSLKSRPSAVKAIGDGHLRRYLKQMALRGKGRQFDEHGNCGKQRLVFAGEHKRLYGLFPGAKLPTYSRPEGAEGDTTTHARALVAILSREGSNVITTKEISKALGVDWRQCSKRLLASSDVEAAMGAFGWRYVAVRGPSGSRFMRWPEEPPQALAA